MEEKSNTAHQPDADAPEMKEVPEDGLKTIDERAHDFALEKCGGRIHLGTKGMMYAGLRKEYIAIAHEQQKVDVEQACEWLRQNYGHLDDPIEELTKRLSAALADCVNE